MQRTVLAIAAMCLLVGTLMLAQSSSQTPATGSAQQNTSNGSNSSQTSQPSQRSTSASGSVSHESKSGNAPSNNPDSTATTDRPNQSSPDARHNAGNGPAIPWMWIILGAAILFVIVMALVSQGSRTTTIERVEHHDDIRRVG